MPEPTSARPRQPELPPSYFAVRKAIGALIVGAFLAGLVGASGSRLVLVFLSMPTIAAAAYLVAGPRHHANLNLVFLVLGLLAYDNVGPLGALFPGPPTVLFHPLNVSKLLGSGAILDQVVNPGTAVFLVSLALQRLLMFCGGIYLVVVPSSSGLKARWRSISWLVDVVNHALALAPVVYLLFGRPVS